MKNDNIDPQVFNFLDELKPVPLRDPHAAARGRSQFLSEAVSLREKQRHSGWMIFPYKETFAMKIVISALVIVGLLFGGATVSAAQDDLPTQGLYQIKLMSEDVHLWFVSDPVQQIDLLMEQEQVRLQEMQTLAEDGVMPPVALAVRAQERIERALQIVNQLDKPSQPAMLQQIRTRLQTQEQQMLQLEQGTCKECIPVLRQTREMLQLHLGKGNDGVGVPGTSHDQNQDRTQTQNQLRINQTPQATGTVTSPYGTCTPALDGTGQQKGSDSLSVATPVQQQNQTQQQNQNQQQNQGGGGTQKGQGSGGGGESSSGSGGGSSNGNGGQGGKP